MEKLCRDFMANKCSRKDCKFKHDSNACSKYYYSNCDNKDCKLNHNHKQQLPLNNNKHNQHQRKSFKNMGL
jgi:hypothetical protein